jgi:hypothetical protein
MIARGQGFGNRLKTHLAVDAVHCEPLSVLKFPITGKNTGNSSAESGLVLLLRLCLEARIKRNTDSEEESVHAPVGKDEKA